MQKEIETVSVPVEYGQSPLPCLRDCLTPENLEMIWALETEEEMKSYLVNDLFNFGDWFFRGDNRADIYSDFYLNMIKYEIIRKILF